jgi:precorrin-6A synthase
MKRKIFVVGMGAGNPEHVTMQAIDALNRASVFFIPNKGEGKAELASLRRDICERFVANKAYRLVNYEVPVRNSSASYGQDVKEWHDAIERVIERLLIEELGEEERGAFLSWGDPGLYDSVLRILERIAAGGKIELDFEVIPGITSVQALAAAHRIPLNRIGESVLITTGRKLAEGFPENADSVVVMLDGQAAFRTVDGDTYIYWGANIGTEHEVLVAGTLKEVSGEIERAREAVRRQSGWVMDTYLLKKRD